MSQETTRCFALVSTQTDAWALFEACRAAGLDARIAPTPRVASAQASCGTSLLVPCEIRDAVLHVAKQCGIPTDGVVSVKGAIDPARDRYC